MSRPKHVLFVCTGNTCRSPMAEAILRHAVEGRGDFQTSSAGLSASRKGSCNVETAALLKRRGVRLEGFGSRPISDSILAAATHVFAMTRDHLEILEEKFPQHSDKYFLVCEFVEIPGKGIGADIPDPIGMGREAYQEVADMLDLAIPTIIDYIDRTWR